MFDPNRNLTPEEIHDLYSCPAVEADTRELEAATKSPIGIPFQDDLNDLAAAFVDEVRRANLHWKPNCPDSENSLLAHMLANPEVSLTKDLALRLLRGGFPPQSMHCRPSFAGIDFMAPRLALLQFAGFRPPGCDEAPGAIQTVMH